MVQKCKQIYCGSIKVTFKQNEEKGKMRKRKMILGPFLTFLPFSRRFKPIGFFETD